MRDNLATWLGIMLIQFLAGWLLIIAPYNAEIFDPKIYAAFAGTGIALLALFDTGYRAYRLRHIPQRLLFWGIVAALVMLVWRTMYPDTIAGLNFDVVNQNAMLLALTFPAVSIINNIILMIRDEAQLRRLAKLRERREANLKKTKPQPVAVVAEQAIATPSQPHVFIHQENTTYNFGGAEQTKTEPPRATPAPALTTEARALEVLGLKKSFTQSELKKKRNQMLQKIHPDQGGSDALVRLINEAFETLKK